MSATAGMVLVFAYLYFVFGRSRSHGTISGSPEAIVSLFVLLLVIGSLFNWLIENSDHPLALSKAQAQFLIAAPLTSRQVMLFKLLTFLPAMLWSAIVMGLVFRGGLSPHPAQRILTAFIVIVALQLQWVGAALARAPKRSESGLPPAVITGIVRLWLVVATAVALAQTASLAAEKGLLGLDKMGIPFAVASRLPWSLVVWPFRALLAPAHAESLAPFAHRPPSHFSLLPSRLHSFFRRSPNGTGLE